MLGAGQIQKFCKCAAYMFFWHFSVRQEKSENGAISHLFCLVKLISRKVYDPFFGLFTLFSVKNIIDSLQNIVFFRKNIVLIGKTHCVFMSVDYKVMYLICYLIVIPKCTIKTHHRHMEIDYDELYIFKIPFI